MKNPNKKTCKILEQIAIRHFDIETLETRHSDRLDFYDVAVWNMRDALQAAFDAGRQAAVEGETA